ncbi:hypothetical protein ACFVIM_00445 [Streptomyces sp. NPDC057638]|uniref:hypothetical protein n=1 Tax=Streptomyces sp. NPDC057638 TaxID=3346190 RepID=UPI0036A7F804
MTGHRTVRDLLNPVAAVALIAQTHPDLPAPVIEVAPIIRDRKDLGTGIRLQMHWPEDGIYERWANLVGSDDPDSHTSRLRTGAGNVVRRTFGTYGCVPIEVIAYLPDIPAATAATVS